MRGRGWGGEARSEAAGFMVTKAAPRSQIPVHFSSLILQSLLLLTAYIWGEEEAER